MYIKCNSFIHAPFKGDRLGVPFSVHVLSIFIYSTHNPSFVIWWVLKGRDASYVSSYSVSNRRYVKLGAKILLQLWVAGCNG